MRRWLAIPLMAVACAGAPPQAPPGSVTVALDRAGYAHGDSATATVTNTGRTLVRFTYGCDGFVEGWTGSGWGTVHEPDCSNLRVRPTELAPGEAVTRTFAMEPCPPGTLARYREFRVRLRYQLPDGRDGVAHSPAFAVRAR